MSGNETDSTSSLPLPRALSLTGWARDRLAVLLTPLARLLDRAGISPNAITVSGLLLSVCAGIALALGYQRPAAALIVVSGLMDGLDGMLARYANKTTPFGAFLDSVLDRWSDSALFVGMLAWYTRAGMHTPAILSSVALATSLLVSYTRARAEGIGAQCKRGVFTRLERLIAIVAGLVLNQMPIALWVIAILSTFTALQRIYLTFKYVQVHLDQEAR